MKWLEKMVKMRLTFNSMFNPTHKAILELPKEEFDILLGFAEKHINQMREDTKKRTNGMASMGKRNCDNIAIMTKKYIEGL